MLQVANLAGPVRLRASQLLDELKFPREIRIVHTVESGERHLDFGEFFPKDPHALRDRVDLGSNHPVVARAQLRDRELSVHLLCLDRMPSGNRAPFYTAWISGIWPANQNLTVSLNSDD